MSTKTERLTRRLGVPLFGLLIGVVMAGAAMSQGEVWLGVAMFGIMAAYSSVLLIFGRSEPVAMLSGASDDERRRMIQWRSGYVSLNVVALVVLGGMVVDLVRGGDGGPWALVAFAGGASFIVALVYFSRRS